MADPTSRKTLSFWIDTTPRTSFPSLAADTAVDVAVIGGGITAPTLVLGAAQDTFFYPREIDATARAYRTQAVIFPGMAHDMMLETRWQVVAERILSWLSELRSDQP